MAGRHADLVVLSAEGRHALVDPLDGSRDWSVSHHHPPDLECMRPAGAPVRDFQAIHRSLFIDQVQDIVGLYLLPPNRAVVLCVDEKSQIQALDCEQPVLLMALGVPERRPIPNIRNGTTSLFAARGIATGAVIGKCYKRLQVSGTGQPSFSTSSSRSTPRRPKGRTCTS